MTRLLAILLGALMTIVVPSFEGRASAQVRTSSTASVAQPAPRRPKRRLRRRRRTPRHKSVPVTAGDRFVRLQPQGRLAVRLPPTTPKNPLLGAWPGLQAFIQPPSDKSAAEWNEALLSVLGVLILALVSMRFLAWLVRRLSRRGFRAATYAERGWRLIEGLAWLGVAVWVLARLATGPGIGSVAVAIGGFVLVVMLAFNAIRDVVAGLLLNLERPFEVGDFVRVAEAEGQVHAFRTRVVELVATDGHRLFVPYRALAGTTDVRPGGRQRAYAVHVELLVPEGIDATDALAMADEVTRASPWATLSSAPRITLREAQGAPLVVDVEAFAFEAQAQPLLHAEILKSWAAVCRRTSSLGG